MKSFFAEADNSGDKNGEWWTSSEAPARIPGKFGWPLQGELYFNDSVSNTEADILQFATHKECWINMLKERENICEETFCLI